MAQLRKITNRNRISKLNSKEGVNNHGFVKISEFNEAVDALNNITDGVFDIADLTVDNLTINENVIGIGAVQFSLTTDSTSKDTGAVILEGGMGVEKSIFAGLTINAGTSATVGTTLNVGTNQTFTKEVAHTVSVTTSTTAATAGGALTIVSGAGATSGEGGLLTLKGGDGGATGNSGGVTISTTSPTAAEPGDITLTGGNATAAAGEGADINITSGNGFTSGTGGDITLTVGSGAVNGASGSNGGDMVFASTVGATATTGTAGTAGRWIFNGSIGGLASGAAGIGVTGTTFSVTTGAGGATTDAAGGAAGAGGAVSFICGNGGAVTNAASASGAGGSMTFSAGTAGSGSTAGANGGNITFTPGAPTGTSGKRGHVIVDKGLVGTYSVKAAINSTNTATVLELATGYITSTSGAATTITLPTGTLFGAELNATQGTTFDFIVDNTEGANTVTIAPGANLIASAWTAVDDALLAPLDIPAGVTGIGIFRIVFSSATAATFSRIG